VITVAFGGQLQNALKLANRLRVSADLRRTRMSSLRSYSTPQGQMAHQHFQEKRHKSISVRLMAIPAEVMNTCLFLNQNDLLCQSSLSLGDAHREPS